MITQIRPSARRLAAITWLTIGLTACGGGGGGGSSPPASPAIIDSTNAPTISQEVLDVGLGAGAFGAAVGGGGILADGGGANALRLGLGQRRTIQQAAHPSVVIPPDTFDCVVSGTVTLSGSIESDATLTPGDRITADFNNCDDNEGAVLEGRLRVDVTSFDGDLFGDLFLLGANLTLTALTVTGDGETTTADGDVTLDLDLMTPLVSDLTLSGSLLEVSEGSDAWILRDFAVTVVEDNVAEPTTRYSGTGTLEGSGFDGAVDYVTVVPLFATGDAFPATGEVLITGANAATIRVTVQDSANLELAIDLDGNGTVDETQQLPWSTVGGLGLVMRRAIPGIP